MKNKGTILISVIILIAVALSIGIVVASVSLGQLQFGLWEQQSAESFYAAQSCVLEDQLRLKSNASYSGSSLTLGNAVCVSTITANGNERTIISTGTSDQVNHKLRVVVRIVGNNVQLLSWEELES